MRLFICLHPPEAWQAGLRRTQEQCRHSFPPEAVRWIPPEQIHLTLQFLGRVPASEAPRLGEALRAACAEVAPFQLEAGEPGQFPARGAPRVLWLGLRAADDTLSRLQRRIAEGTAEWAEEKEANRFHPHLTLGRCRQAPRGKAQCFLGVSGREMAARFSPWRVDAVLLMRSRLHSGGAIHDVVERFPLEPQ